MATDIVKLVSREVQFWEDGRLVQTLQEDCTANLSRDRNGIIIEDIKGKKYQIFTANIDTTKLDPAPSIKFVGTTVDLWDLLFASGGANFFNELHIGSSGGSNTVDETNIKIIPGPTYTVLSTDYILWVTGNCTITLPLIPAIAIAFPIRIFCRNVNVTVNATAPDLINGAAFFKMKKYDQVTIRPGQANDWGLGD
jgi:hypothetical protein